MGTHPTTIIDPRATTIDRGTKAALFAHTKTHTKDCVDNKTHVASGIKHVPQYKRYDDGGVYAFT